MSSAKRRHRQLLSSSSTTENGRRSSSSTAKRARYHFSHASSLPSDEEDNFLTATVPQGGLLLSTGGAVSQEGVIGLAALQDEIANESTPHREDGYDEQTREYFGERWNDTRALHHQLLTSHPDYEFMVLVSGYSNRPIDKLYDRESFDMHTKRMLQRAGFADELRQSTLTDIDKTQSFLQKARARGNLLVADAGNLRRVKHDLDYLSSQYIRVESIIRRVEANLYPKTGNGDDDGDQGFVASTFDVYFSFAARCLYPTDGLDSPSFAHLVMSHMINCARSPSLLYSPGTTAVSLTRKLEEAAAHLPTTMQLCAYVTFAVYLARTRSALVYVARRLTDNDVFPKNGLYSRDPDAYVDDVRKLVQLFTPKSLPAAGRGDDEADELRADTYHAVTLQTMSARLYLHLKCMSMRWFGPPANDDDKDDMCTSRRPPELHRPRVPESLKIDSDLMVYYGNGDEDSEDDDDIKLFEVEAEEGSALLDEQRRPLVAVGEDQFQELIAIVLGSAFDHGMATLVFDMERLRSKLKEDFCATESLEKSMGCKGNLSSTMKHLNAIEQPVYSLSYNLSALGYFYGGVDIRLSGVSPDTAWRIPELVHSIPVVASSSANDGVRQDTTAVHTFFFFAYELYKKTVDTVQPMSDKQGDLVEWWVWDDSGYNPVSQWTDELRNLRMEAFRADVECSLASQQDHSTMRLMASLQTTGALEWMINVVRTMRSLHDTYETVVKQQPKYQNNTLASTIATYLSEHDEDALLKNSTSEEATRALRIIATENLTNSTGRLKVRGQIDAARVNLAILERRLDADAKSLDEETGRAMDYITQRVNRNYNTSLTNGTEPEALVRRLKKILAETYIPSPDWGTAPENTGILYFSNIYIAAVKKAYGLVQEKVSNFKEATLDDLKFDAMTQDIFAELVAVVIKNIEARANRSLILNRTVDDILHETKDILHRFRRLKPLRYTGRGTGNIRRRSSAAESPYPFSNPDLGTFTWVRNLPSTHASQPSKGGMLGALPRYAGRWGGGSCGSSARNSFVTRASNQRPVEITRPAFNRRGGGGGGSAATQQDTGSNSRENQRLQFEQRIEQLREQQDAERRDMLREQQDLANSISAIVSEISRMKAEERHKLASKQDRGGTDELEERIEALRQQLRSSQRELSANKRRKTRSKARRRIIDDADSLENWKLLDDLELDLDTSIAEGEVEQSEIEQAQRESTNALLRLLGDYGIPQGLAELFVEQLNYVAGTEEWKRLDNLIEEYIKSNNLNDEEMHNDFDIAREFIYAVNPGENPPILDMQEYDSVMGEQGQSVVDEEDDAISPEEARARGGRNDAGSNTRSTTSVEDLLNSMLSSKLLHTARNGELIRRTWSAKLLKERVSLAAREIRPISQ